MAVHELPVHRYRNRLRLRAALERLDDPKWPRFAPSSA